MRKWISAFDPGFLVIGVLALIALWPFLINASLPEGTDAELHIFRLAELSYLLRGGEIYPRWAPNFFHGFGYPIFNYYAPFTYYLGSLVEFLPRVDVVDAVKTLFVGGIFLAAIGMYGFVRDNWGRRAGYVAAAVFIYAPYIQYIDPHVRGVLPESFSFGLFAIALWSVDRLARSGRMWPWLTAVLVTAALIMTHNLMGLLFFSWLFTWMVWRIVGRRHRSSGTVPAKLSLKMFGRRLEIAPDWVAIGALLLSLGVAAIFWLPVLLESSAVNLNTLIGQENNYDFHSHFISIAELSTPSLWIDWGAAQPAFRFNLGVAQWVLGLLGIVMLLLRKLKHAWHFSFFVLSLVVFIFLMLPISVFLWENAPFLPFFQFPWRLLGPAAAMLAVVGGVGSGALFDLIDARGAAIKSKKHLTAWLAGLFVAVPMLLAIPLSQVAPWPDFGEVFTLRMSLIENSGRWLGTTSTDDYIPTTVDIIPRRQSSVVANFKLGLPPDHINHAMLPEGSTIETETIRPLLTRYTTNTPRKTLLRLFLFDFPGWQARIDGEPVAKQLGRPEGFLVIPLPAGEHVVEIEFGSTPARDLATFLTLLGLAAMLYGLFVLPRKGENFLPLAFGQLHTWRDYADWPVLGIVAGVTAVFAILSPQGIFHIDSTGSTVIPAQQRTFADFDNSIALLGFDLPGGQIDAGDELDLMLYWKAQQPLDINYQVFVHLFDADGNLVAQSDKLNPGDYPTRRWTTDKYVRDPHSLVLPPDLPSGTYTVTTGLWVQAEGWRSPLVDESGTQVDDKYILFSFTVP